MALQAGTDLIEVRLLVGFEFEALVKKFVGRATFHGGRDQVVFGTGEGKFLIGVE